MKKYKKIKDNKSSGKAVKVRIKNKAITSEISTKKKNEKYIVCIIFGFYNINRKNRIYSNSSGRRIIINGI